MIPVRLWWTALSNAWVARPEGACFHIVPISDMRDHAASESCWCRPWLNEDANGHYQVRSRSH